jgi:hypothetical protein
MYWLSADSKERAEDESWINYSHRSCAEVLDAFRRRVSEADFAKEAAGWPAPIDPIKHLVFVAYFVTESDLAELAKKIAAR